MKRTFFVLACCAVIFGSSGLGIAQEVKIKNAKKWEFTGRAQLQYLFNADTEGDASKTNSGFRIRRGRLQVKAKLTDWVSTKFQIEVRDNTPKLKDAEGKIKFGQHFFARFGQFKVPVWREEMRSSSKLFLVERSEAAEMLGDLHLIARHIGVEFGGKYDSGLSWAANFSNGAGEGGREDAGRSKSEFVNNGKMVAGRVNYAVNKSFEIAVSAVANQAGSKNAGRDDSGTIFAIAPDFGFYTKIGERAKFEIEGGVVFGSVEKKFAGTADDIGFTVADVSGWWTRKLAGKNESLGGLDAVEFAAGISYQDPDSDVDKNEAIVLRGGPAVYFGKTSRLQINAELEMPTADGANSVFKIRAQTTFNF